MSGGDAADFGCVTPLERCNETGGFDGFPPPRSLPSSSPMRTANSEPPPQAAGGIDSLRAAGGSSSSFSADFPPPAPPIGDGGGVVGESSLSNGKGLAELVLGAEGFDAGLRGARAVLEGEREGVGIARSRLLPQASASASRSFAGGGTPDAKRAGAELVQTFSLPRRESLRAAEKTAAAAAAEFRGQLQSLRARVVRGWLRAQLASDTLLLLSARKKTLGERLKLAEKLLAAGSALRADALRARARVFDVEAQRAQARNELADARAELERLTGAVPQLAKIAGDAEFAKPQPLAEWRERIAANSPRLKAAALASEAARFSLAAAEKSAYPELDVSLGAASDNRLRRFDERLQFSLRQPLYTGGRIGAEKRRLMANARLQDARLLAARREVGQQARQRHGAMESARARMRALSAAVAASAEALGAVDFGHRQGTRTTADVLSAEEELFDSRLQLRRAQYNYLENLTLLRELAGGVDDGFVVRVESFFAPGGDG